MPNSKRPRNWNVSAQHTTATKSQGRINVFRKDLNMCCTSSKSGADKPPGQPTFPNPKITGMMVEAAARFRVLA